MEAIKTKPDKRAISEGTYSDEIAREYAEAYRRVPETEEERAWAELATRAAIASEPW